MNKLHLKKRAQILHMLVEGNSLRSAARMADVSRNTIDKLLRDVGSACQAYQDETLRDLPCKRVQADEIWSFCYAKAANVPEDKKGQFGYGDIWTWTALCADSKLAICWHVGPRNGEAAGSFVDDLASRLAGRIQFSTDGLRLYIDAVEDAFAGDIDYSQLIKMYGTDSAGNEKRYSPSRYIGSRQAKINGNPDEKHVSTSYVERQNLTMRMGMRRFTRLTNGHSKKVENHMHAISLHYMFYNFGRLHQTLRVTPAMQAGISDHVWSLEEIASLTDKYPN